MVKYARFDTKLTIFVNKLSTGICNIPINVIVNLVFLVTLLSIDAPKVNNEQMSLRLCDCVHYFKKLRVIFAHAYR